MYEHILENFIIQFIIQFIYRIETIRTTNPEEDNKAKWNMKLKRLTILEQKIINKQFFLNFYNKERHLNFVCSLSYSTSNPPQKNSSLLKIV